MSQSNGPTHGLIRSCASWSRVTQIDGVKTMEVLIAEQPCSRQRWKDIYAERNEVEGTTFHGRYCEGVVDLFLDDDGEELPGLKQFLQNEGATVRVYAGEADDDDSSKHNREEDESGIEDMLEPVFDIFACGRALLDRCKHTLLGLITTTYPHARHILLVDEGLENASLLLLIVDEKLFEQTYNISSAHQLVTVTANGVRYAVIGLYEKAAADEIGELEFSCVSDRAVSFFSKDGNHAVVNVLDIREDEIQDDTSLSEHKLPEDQSGAHEIDFDFHDAEGMSVQQTDF